MKKSCFHKSRYTDGLHLFFATIVHFSLHIDMFSKQYPRFHRSITLATISTGNLVFDAPACMLLRFENFLRGVAVHHALHCVKGHRKLSPAIFATKIANFCLASVFRLCVPSKPSILDLRFDDVLLCNGLQNRFRNDHKSSILDPRFDDVLLCNWLQNRYKHTKIGYLFNNLAPWQQRRYSRP